MSNITHLIRSAGTQIPLALRKDFPVVAGVCCIENTVLLCESAWARNAGFDEVYILPQREVGVFESKLQFTFQELAKELTTSTEKPKWRDHDVLSEEWCNYPLLGTYSSKRYRIFCMWAHTETFHIRTDPKKYGAHVLARDWYELEDYLSALAEYFPNQYLIIRRAVLRACARNLLAWRIPDFLMRKFQREEAQRRAYAPKPL